MRNDLAGPNHDISADWTPRKGPDTADEALIAKIAAGNRLAMQVLFARHHTRGPRIIAWASELKRVAEVPQTEGFDLAKGSRLSWAVHLWLLRGDESLWLIGAQ